MIRLAVRVAGEHAETVLAELLELAPAGVEEVRDEAGTVEYAVYGPPGELPALPDLRALAGDALVELSTSEIADDWHERWREFHRPVLIDAPDRGGPAPVGGGPAPVGGKLAPVGGGPAPVPSLYVRPPWEPAHGEREGAVRELVIDPGQAFGTGAHASTRLCLELLLALAGSEPARGAVLDVGSGSGVLAIAAAALGFGPVLALDNEWESVRAARENAIVNGTPIEVRHCDLRSGELPWPRDANGRDRETVVLANLLRPLLMALTDALPIAPAHLLAGGLLAAEVDEVAGAFAARLGLRERERRESGGWAAVWLSAG